MKIRLSYGEVGNDQIGGGRRFPYLTLINFGGGSRWGSNGLTEKQIGANNLHWEVAKKYNLGIDFQFLNDKIGGTVDIFRDTRDNIFQERKMMPSEVGVVTNPYTNVGRMRSSGIDGNIYLNQKINEDNSFTVRANMTYAVSKVVHWDQDAVRYPYQSYSDVNYGVMRGLVALGLLHTPMYRKFNTVLHWSTDIKDGLSVLYSLEQPKLTSYTAVPDSIPSQAEKSATFYPS